MNFLVITFVVDNLRYMFEALMQCFTLLQLIFGAEPEPHTEWMEKSDADSEYQCSESRFGKFITYPKQMEWKSS